IELEMSDLRHGVDTGVRPAGAVELELLPARHVLYGAFDLTRDGSRVLLDLPAAVTRAGVLDYELEPRHSSAVLAMAVSWNPTPVRSAIVICSADVRPGFRPATTSPSSACTRSAWKSPASSPWRNSPNAAHCVSRSTTIRSARARAAASSSCLPGESDP